MSTNDDRPREYLDSRAARELQDDRERDAATARPRAATDAPAQGRRRRGVLARLGAWLRQLLGHDGRTGAVLVVVALAVSACGGSGDTATEAGTPAETGAATETGAPAETTSPTEAAQGPTECHDASDDVYAVDPGPLPTDDTPNLEAVDIPHASVNTTRDGEELVLLFRRPEPQPRPERGTHVQHELMLEGEDGTTGLLRATWESGPEGDWEVLAGTSEDSLEPIEPRQVRAEPAQTVIRVAWDDMPLEPPFAWAAEVTMVETGVADICPNVDPDDPFAVPDALPTFPGEDVEVTS